MNGQTVSQKSLKRGKTTTTKSELLLPDSRHSLLCFLLFLLVLLMFIWDLKVSVFVVYRHLPALRLTDYTNLDLIFSASFARQPRDVSCYCNEWTDYHNKLTYCRDVLTDFPTTPFNYP